MARFLKRQKVDAEDFDLVTLENGKTEIDLPMGDLDIWAEWYADKECVVWIYFDTGLTLPYAQGMNGAFNVLTKNAISLVLTSAKSATVAVCVKTKNLAIKEQADWTPVEITPPRPAELQISALVSEQVRRELENMGVLTDDQLEVGDEDNLEDEDDDEGFGPGYMEEEELPPQPVRKKGAAGTSSPFGDAPADVSTGDGSTAEPVPSPGPPAKP